MNLAAPAALAAALWLASTGGPWAQDGVVHRETGTASFYGPELAGRRTASGERYDPAGLTAAHPTLPFGAEVTVVALASGRTVTVEVNDRGPFTGGRMIDLSLRAARGARDRQVRGRQGSDQRDARAAAAAGVGRRLSQSAANRAASATERASAKPARPGCKAATARPESRTAIATPLARTTWPSRRAAVSAACSSVVGCCSTNHGRSHSRA